MDLLLLPRHCLCSASFLQAACSAAALTEGHGGLLACWNLRAAAGLLLLPPLQVVLLLQLQRTQLAEPSGLRRDPVSLSRLLALLLLVLRVVLLAACVYHVAALSACCCTVSCSLARPLLLLLALRLCHCLCPASWMSRLR